MRDSESSNSSVPFLRVTFPLSLTSRMPCCVSLTVLFSVQPFRSMITLWLYAKRMGKSSFAFSVYVSPCFSSSTLTVSASTSMPPSVQRPTQAASNASSRSVYSLLHVAPSEAVMVTLATASAVVSPPSGVSVSSAGAFSCCSSCTIAPPSGASASAAHAGAGRSVRHRASAMNILNTRFFISFLLEKSSCLYMEIQHLPDAVFTGRPALNAASSLLSWPPPGASHPAFRECG